MLPELYFAIPDQTKPPDWLPETIFTQKLVL